jgi:hypothetical protein
MRSTCETLGCFRTAYDSKLCSKCLDGRLPMTRGPVTVFEWMRARAYGGTDLLVTIQRMQLHGQPYQDT